MMTSEFVSFLNKSSNSPFVWGKHDCLTFANKAVELQRGNGFIDEYLGGYTSAKGAFLKYIRAQRESIYKDIIDLADDRLFREYTLHPAFGNIIARKTQHVALGWAFGVAVGNGIMFLDEGGAELLAPNHNDLIWSAT